MLHIHLLYVALLRLFGMTLSLSSIDVVILLATGWQLYVICIAL